MNKKLTLPIVVLIGFSLFSCNSNNQSSSISSQELDSSSIHEHEGKEWKHDEATHYHECSICHEKFDIDYHTGGEATCTSKAVCSVCGTEYGELVDHTYSDWSPVAATNKHHRICSECGHEETGDHVFNIQKESPEYVKIAGNCTTTAVYYLSCICGMSSQDDSLTFEVQTSHEFVQAISTSLDTTGSPINLISEADCEKPAKYYEICKHCGEIGEEEFEYGEALGHKYVHVDGSETSYASGCVEHEECSRCGKYFLKEGEIYTEIEGASVLTSQLNDSQFVCSEETPYLISNEKDLCTLRDVIGRGTADEPATYSGCYFKMTADITLTEDWLKPIGLNSSTSVFKGIFDGNNHTISGLHIERVPGCTALFGNAVDATIKNLNLDDVNLSSTSSEANTAQRTAAVVGRGERVTLENVNVLGGEINGSQENGGLIGCVVNGATIKKCTNKATVNTTKNKCGGLIGNNYSGSTTITDCKNYGETNGLAATGGLVGTIAGGTLTISNSSNIGEVHGKGEGVGGIVGWQNNSASKLYINNCVNSVAVINKSGNNGTAGFLGLNIESSYVEIHDSVNFGEVSSNNGPFVGGFVGLLRLSTNPEGGGKAPCSIVKNCIDYGNISGKAGDTCGAIIGINRGKIIDCKVYVEVTVNGVIATQFYGNQNNGGTSTEFQTINE